MELESKPGSEVLYLNVAASVLGTRTGGLPSSFHAPARPSVGPPAQPPCESLRVLGSIQSGVTTGND